MNKALNVLGYSEWQTIWSPDSSSKQGEILYEDKLILIYNEKKADAWDTFTHEIIELKLRPLTNVYRLGFNALLKAYEGLVYERKEKFINELPELLETIEEFSPAN